MQRARSLTPLLLLIAIALLAYASLLHAPLIGDDEIYIPYLSANASQHDFSYLITEIAADRPLLMLTFWLNSLMGGAEPFYYRLTSVLLHALNGFVLFHLLLLLGRVHLGGVSRRLALLVAALYVAHPVHHQAVWIICQRAGPMAAFFGLLTFYFFARHLEVPSRRDRLLSILFMVCALLSKVTAISFPPILFLYAVGVCRKKVWEAFKELLPHFCAFAIPILFYAVLKINPHENQFTWYQYFSIQTRVLYTYFRLFFLPVHLRYLYSVNPDASVLANFTWLAILGHLAIISTALYGLRKRPLLAFSVLATYLALGPESSIFSLGYLSWEYRTYFPFAMLMIGVLTLLTWLKPGRRFYVATAMGALVPVFMVLTWSRTTEIDTRDKWISNTIHYTKDHHIFNSLILNGFLMTKDFRQGGKYADQIEAANPGVEVYSLYARIFKYLPVKSEKNKAILEYVGNRLRHVSEYPMPGWARVEFNHFVMDGLLLYLDGKKFYEKVEDLLFPQIIIFRDTLIPARTLIEATTPRHVEIYSNYSVALNYLKECYEKEILQKTITPAEYFRYLKVLSALEILFEKKSVELPALYEAHFKKHPGSAKEKAIYQWYLDARKNPEKPTTSSGNASK